MFEISLYKGKFEMFITSFANLMTIGYRSLCAKRRDNAVHAGFVAYVVLKEHISFVILLT